MTLVNGITDMIASQVPDWMSQRISLRSGIGKTMSKVIGFNIIDMETGDKLGTFSLDHPIGETVSDFQDLGYKVIWNWETVND